jgi:hypothetical protein
MTAHKAEAVFQWVKEAWTELGDPDPHWTVLASAEYRSDKRNPQALKDFYASEFETACLLEEAFQRSGSPRKVGSCLRSDSEIEK